MSFSETEGRNLIEVANWTELERHAVSRWIVHSGKKRSGLKMEI